MNSYLNCSDIRRSQAEGFKTGGADRKSGCDLLDYFYGPIQVINKALHSTHLQAECMMIDYAENQRIKATLEQYL
jgi:hypothetical protein